MKSLLFIYFGLVFFVGEKLAAQRLISVHGSNSVSFYEKVDEAIYSANNGDTIYIPGGFWELSGLITKSLHLIGVGHNPDTAKASLITILQGQLVIEGSNGSITGVYITGGIWEYYNYPISNYRVIRCRVEGGIHLTSACTNWNFIENIIHGGVENLSNAPSSNCSFYNNIFDGSTRWAVFPPFINCIFKNNLYLAQSNVNGSGFFPIFSSKSLYENNIFIGNENNGLSVTYRDANSIYNNNIFVENWGSPSIGTCNCLGSNNIINQPKSSIFVNQNGNLFNYAHDYHLQSGNPGKNAGTDGQDIGIYGGFYPWKDGSLPSYPQIEFKQISNNTDQNGNLKINIKVKAQNN